MVSDTTPDVRFDWLRAGRTGVPEAVFCEGKSSAQLHEIIAQAAKRDMPLLFTRLSIDAHAALSDHRVAAFDYDPVSHTAILGSAPQGRTGAVAIVCAGSSDMPVAAEAQRTLAFMGLEAPVFADVGVAGLWRLLEIVDDLRAYPVLIAVAGMEGALFSVLAGLVPSLVIAVPTSVGYGVSHGGKAALSSALSSCAPGVVTVNIDNGFGAASAAVKIAGLARR